MADPHQAFLRTAVVAQRTAGVIAARHRGDHAGAEILLRGVDDHTRASGSQFLADLALRLLAQAEGRDVADVASELSRHLAELIPATGGGQ